MGQYLTVGITHRISIEKNTRLANAKLEDIIVGLSGEVNIDCYNYYEKEDAHCWEIKPALLEDDLAGFLEAQFQFYKGKRCNDIDMALQRIKDAKNAKEILELSKDRSLIYFQHTGYTPEYIEVQGWNIPVYFELIAYLMNGKIIMECYKEIFQYFEYNIRLQKEKFPILDCVKVVITG